jgi:uncharacterized RDD family membrane protein YckC
MNYAGFWSRFGAKILDGLILTVPLIVVIVVFFSTLIPALQNVQGRGNTAMIAILAQFAIVIAIYFALSLGYHIFFVGRYGATPGKMACGLKIVTAEGNQVSYLRATGRYFAEIGIVSIGNGFCYVLGYADYITAAFDKEKRALHDFICNTRVIYK